MSTSGLAAGWRGRELGTSFALVCPKGQSAWPHGSHHQSPALLLQMINFCTSTAFTNTPGALILMNHLKCYALWKGNTTKVITSCFLFFVCVFVCFSTPSFAYLMCCPYMNISLMALYLWSCSGPWSEL